ncbi:MAG: hypothetical protein Kapaf2KO_08960 [Candidatus Kapaibacteriales bacterium]
MRSILLFLATVFLLSFYDTTSQEYDKWFEDATSPSGLDSAKGSKVVVADVNGDLWPDILLGNGGLIKNTFTLYINTEAPDGNRTFVDKTIESGINKRRFDREGDRIADVLALADVDNDGDLDIITSIYYHRWEMYNTPEKDPGDRSEILINDGLGNFSLMDDNGLWDVTIPEENSPALNNATGLATVDFDLDGDLDLYISQWFEDYKQNLEVNQFNFKFEDLLYENDGTGKFTLLPSQPSFATAKEANYGVNVLDWNNDGLTDITTSAYCRSGGSLLQNTGDFRFENVTSVARLNSQPMQGDNGQNLCQWEGMPADFDNDGDFDIFHTLVHGGMADTEGRSFISENTGAENGFRFEPRMDIIKRGNPFSAHVSDMGSCWIDLDNDGLQDLIIAHRGYININPRRFVNLFIMHQQEDNTFNDVTIETGTRAILLDPHSPVPIDYDLDGDVDIVTSFDYRDTIDGEPRPWSALKLIENKVGNIPNWATVRLVNFPQGVNTFGIGSRLEFYSGDLVQTRELHNSQGHFGGQQDYHINIGLGDKPYIDSLVVYLPDNIRTRKVIYNLDVNAFMEIDIENSSIIHENMPAVHFTTSKSVFDTLELGTKKQYSVFIKNHSNQQLDITDIYIPEGGAFTILNSDAIKQNSPYAGGSEIEVIVEAAPLQRQLYEEDIVVEYNGGRKASREYRISVYGFTPAAELALSEEVLQFDNVWIDETSESTIMISNNGERPLEIDLTTLEIVIDNNTRAKFNFVTEMDEIVTLDPEETFDLMLSFTPDTVGTYNATVMIPHNGFNQDLTELDIIGVCDGPLPTGRVSSIITFGTVAPGEEKEREITIESDGLGDLIVTDVSVMDFEEVFNVTDVNYPLRIPQGEKGTLKLVFSPNQENYTYNTSLLVESNTVEEAIDKIIFARSGEIKSIREQRNGSYFYNTSNKALILNRRGKDSQLVGNYRVDVVDITGRAVLENRIWENGTQELELDLSGIRGAVYILILDSETGVRQNLNLMIE